MFESEIPPPTNSSKSTIPVGGFLMKVLTEIKNVGGNPFFVGGCVRDKILNIPYKDVDVEVFDIDYERLANLLAKFGKVSIVGESFGTIKLITEEQIFDFTLPRKDNKYEPGHKGFYTEINPKMSIREASKRRDFTINAILESIDGQIIDNWNGVVDIRNGVLSYVDPESFQEDPLRVLRGFQLCGRFRLTSTYNTQALCRVMLKESHTLCIERVWMEWFKWAEKSQYPSYGLDFLAGTRWLYLYPELAKMVGVPQDPGYHPEGQTHPMGSLWVHTKHATDAAAMICDRNGIGGEDKVVIVLAALCHDMGKPETTIKINGNWRSPQHDKIGVVIAEKFLYRIGCLDRIIQRVLPLVSEHMICYGSTVMTEKLVRKLSYKLGKASIRELLMLIEADHSARPPLIGGLPLKAEDLMAISKELKLENSKSVCFITGKDLISRGHKPGPLFKRVLERCLNAQLEGIFYDRQTALTYLDVALSDHTLAQ